MHISIAGDIGLLVTIPLLFDLLEYRYREEVLVSFSTVRSPELSHTRTLGLSAIGSSLTEPAICSLSVGCPLFHGTLEARSLLSEGQLSASATDCWPSLIRILSVFIVHTD